MAGNPPRAGLSGPNIVKSEKTIIEELVNRGWSQAEIARQAGIPYYDLWRCRARGQQFRYQDGKRLELLLRRKVPE